MILFLILKEYYNLLVISFINSIIVFVISYSYRETLLYLILVPYESVTGNRNLLVTGLFDLLYVYLGLSSFFTVLSFIFFSLLTFLLYIYSSRSKVSNNKLKKRITLMVIALYIWWKLTLLCGLNGLHFFKSIIPESTKYGAYYPRIDITAYGYSMYLMIYFFAFLYFIIGLGVLFSFVFCVKKWKVIRLTILGVQFVFMTVSPPDFTMDLLFTFLWIIVLEISIWFVVVLLSLRRNRAVESEIDVICEKKFDDDRRKGWETTDTEKREFRKEIALRMYELEAEQLEYEAIV